MVAAALATWLGGCAAPQATPAPESVTFVDVQPSLALEGTDILSQAEGGGVFIEDVSLHATQVRLLRPTQPAVDLLSLDPISQEPLTFTFAEDTFGSQASSSRQWPTGVMASSEGVIEFTFDAFDADGQYTPAAVVHGYYAVRRPSKLHALSGDPDGVPARRKSSGDPDGVPARLFSGDPDGVPARLASGDPDGVPARRKSSGDPDGVPAKNRCGGDEDGTKSSGDPDGVPARFSEVSTHLDQAALHAYGSSDADVTDEFVWQHFELRVDDTWTLQLPVSSLEANDGELTLPMALDVEPLLGEHQLLVLRAQASSNNPEMIQLNASSIHGFVHVHGLGELEQDVVLGPAIHVVGDHR